MDLVERIKVTLAVLFCAMFCFLFLDKFWFGGQLGMRIRTYLVILLRGIAGWLESPASASSESADSGAPLKGPSGGNDDGLVPESASTMRQHPPMSANNRHAEQSAEGVNTFDSARQPEKRANPLQGMFTDLDRVDFDIDPRLMKEKGETVSLPIPSLSDTDTSYGDLPDESMDSEEMERFADASPEAWDCGHGIGAQEMDWIIDLCSGRAVPPDKRQAVVKAIHALRNTAIQKALLSGINDSDARITRFLDEAEEEADQTTTSDA